MGISSLAIQEPDGSKRIVPLDKPVFTLGRAPRNNIVLADTELSVSRRHAVFECGLEFVELRDEGSTNGTFLNGQQLAGPVCLRDGDSIEIGLHKVAFRDSQEDVWPWEIEAADAQAGSSQLPDALRGAEVTLAGRDSVKDLEDALVRLLLRIDGVERATVWLWDEGAACFRQRLFETTAGGAAPSGSDVDPQLVILNAAVLNSVRERNQCVFVRSRSRRRAGIQAAFCSPLTPDGKFLGVLYADNLSQPGGLSKESFRAFASFSTQAGLALAKQIARDELWRKDMDRAIMRRYLAPQVVDLITSRGGSLELGGSLKAVTVLFADIRGFTRLTERMDAQELVSLLNEFFTVMTDVIFQSNGTLDKFIGDAVMALFGVPIPSERSPVRALLAGVRMQQRVAQLNAERLRRGEDRFEIGVGLHHGMAVVGNIGSAQRIQYTAVGDTVNIAQRLADSAKPSQILVSQAMFEAAGATDVFEDLGWLSVKGRVGRVRTYSVAWDRLAEPMTSSGNSR